MRPKDMKNIREYGPLKTSEVYYTTLILYTTLIQRYIILLDQLILNENLDQNLPVVNFSFLCEKQVVTNQNSKGSCCAFKCMLHIA